MSHETHLTDPEKVSLEAARAALLERLRHVSEAATCAGWYGALEFIVWDRLGRAPSRLGQLVLDEALLTELELLARRAGGWFVYEPDADDPEFIPLADWQPRYEAWLRAVPEASRPRDR